MLLVASAQGISEEILVSKYTFEEPTMHPMDTPSVLLSLIPSPGTPSVLPSLVPSPDTSSALPSLVPPPDTPSVMPSLSSQSPSSAKSQLSSNNIASQSLPTSSPSQSSQSLTEDFVPGDLVVQDVASGLLLSRGLSVRLLAQSGSPVPYTSANAKSSESTMTFHTQPDAGAVFSLEDGGWVYMSNDENEEEGQGGAYALIFDAKGEIVSYEKRLGNTTRNCGGGKTPHGTWISCEEYHFGMCHQVDPTGRRETQVTKLTELTGGYFESMACDNRNASSPVFFTTEDNLLGALRRYRPDPFVAQMGGWDMLHLEGGTLDYLQFLPNNTFTWSTSMVDGRVSAYYNYPNSEGIDHSNGRLYFVSKRFKALYILNLDKHTYEVEHTNEGVLMKNGTGFGDSPDQVIVRGGEDLVFLTEDGGFSPGVYARNLTDNGYYTIFEAWNQTFYGDETCGLAFSPSRHRMYFALQEAGRLFEITRDDGKPFYGREMMLKSHRVKEEERR